MKRVLMIVASICLAVLSCNKPETGDDSDAGCVTQWFKDLTEISVTLIGQANLPSEKLSAVEMGFIYSSDPEPAPENGTVVKKDELLVSGQFKTAVSGLKSNATYYYRAYIKDNGAYAFGETKHFTTMEIHATVITGAAVNVTSSSATLTSSCTFSGNVLSPQELISFLYYYVSDTASDLNGLIGTGQRIRAESDGNRSEAVLEGLRENTTYYFVAGYSVKGLDSPVYGKVNEFFTADPAQGTLHKCSETRIKDDMIFSSCCARTTTSVQQGFDYDPVDNTLYFFQLNRWYRNIIGWTRPQVTLSTEKAPHYMGLSCFSHGNNIIFERTSSGEKYIWAPNFGTRGDGSYGSPWIVSRLPLKETTKLSEDIPNTAPDENYYFGISPCWPAIDFDDDLIAICNYKKVYVYRLSEIRALPKTTVRLPQQITYGGIMTNSGSTTTYDTGIPEFTGYPEIVARDASKVTPLIIFDNDYGKRGLHWQTFCIDNGKAYFLDMGDVPDDSIIRHDTYIEVYDLKTGKLLRPKVRQEYIQDKDGLADRGYVEPDYCYAEPEGIKVMGDVMYVMYTCRGNTNITTRRPVIFKLSSEL